jgi:hypothetical protein
MLSGFFQAIRKTHQSQTGGFQSLPNASRKSPWSGALTPADLTIPRLASLSALQYPQKSTLGRLHGQHDHATHLTAIVYPAAGLLGCATRV